MAARDHISIGVTSRTTADLVAYGAVLRFGEHSKTKAACFSQSTTSVQLALMLGVVDALKSIKAVKPFNITIMARNSHDIQNHFATTAILSLRDDLRKAAETHSLSWESVQTHPDMDLCDSVADDGIRIYAKAWEMVEPCIDHIREVALFFNVGFDSRLAVSCAETDEPGEPLVSVHVSDVSLF